MNAVPTFAMPWPEVPAPRISRPLKLAIAASIGVHVLALAWQHDLLPKADDTPPTLNVVLRAPAPVVQPAPAPEPVARVEAAAAARGDAGNRRLHHRWSVFEAHKKRHTVANTAIARELAGWCWSLAVMT